MSTEGDRTRLTGLLESLGQPGLEYSVNMVRWPATMKSGFVELGPDDALVAYLERILAGRASTGKTRLQRLLRWLVSDYDANAVLRMYPMHLLSTSQAEQLLGRGRGGRLLDIGAGSGDVTQSLAPLFDTVTAVETSRFAARRLAQLGFATARYDVTRQGVQGGPYDVIALLNVLDRTTRPLTLLEQCRSAMSPASRLLLSIPLPYRPHAYAGAMTRAPEERLAIVGSDFSDCLMRLVNDVLRPIGLAPLRLTRLPYVSGGDSSNATTVLSAAVVVCQREA
ncbi:MAG TPA: methyltransferase domain-containing protein [Polyangiaceae bacterium]|nr:methyltransferase domain-containing protein [Polyangiaceae bacterium]